MLHDILFALWFLLPAALANVAPIFGAVLPGIKRFNAPIDGSRTYRGKELLGSHKTWRGLLVGMLVSTVVFYVQQYLYRTTGWGHTLAEQVNYTQLSPLLGPLFGLGALGADAIESFFKRQRGVPSGSAWIPFDQLDYIIGGLLASLPFVIISAVQYVTIVAVYFGMHLLASYVGFLIGLKEKPI